MNLKIPRAIFLIIPFPNIKKNLVRNLKIPSAIFLFIPCSIIQKKEYLGIFKFLEQFFFVDPFLKH